MNEEKQLPLVTGPSLGKIMIATVVMLIVAAVILVVAILPAEYGIDPLGTGKKLGLMDLAKASGAGAATPKVTGEFADATILPVLDPVEQKSKWGTSPVMKGALIPQEKGFNFDSREFTLKPGEGLEYKYNMKKGAGLVYSWVASGKLLYDFHGQPDVKPEGVAVTDYFESYDRDDKVGKDRLQGTLVAPRTGIHGWFWENAGTEPVTVKLVSAGYFEWVFQNIEDKQKALMPISPDLIPSHPKLPDADLPH
jgi:hypothetical protein